MVEIWLTEPYFKDFASRRGVLFRDEEAKEIYAGTQLLQEKWPGCIHNPPPEVGSKSKLFYMKYNWSSCKLRICFGAHTEKRVQKLIALTCRTKQELSKGGSNGTQEWYRHMASVGVDRWDDYQRNLVVSWKIY